MAEIDLEEESKKNETKEFVCIQFQAGEFVAHPVHGLCRIEKIENTNIGEGRQLYYTFLIGASRLKIKVFVAISEASRLGIRYPITRLEALDILRILETSVTDSDTSQRDCFEQISASLSTGDLFQLAQHVRTARSQGASFLNGDFEESFSHSQRRDQALLTKAIQRVADELAFVLRESSSIMRKRICKKWNKKGSNR